MNSYTGSGSPQSPAGPVRWRPPAVGQQRSGLPPELSPDPQRRRWASPCTGCWCWSSNPARDKHQLFNTCRHQTTLLTAPLDICTLSLRYLYVIFTAGSQQLRSVLDQINGSLKPLTGAVCSLNKSRTKPSCCCHKTQVTWLMKYDCRAQRTGSWWTASRLQSEQEVTETLASC